MKASGILAVLFTALCLNAVADTVALSDSNPYAAVVERNMFGLVPMPTNPPVDSKPPDPPTKITPNGIMSIFGQLEALFKVAVPAKTGSPAHDQAYTLAVGERADDIEVTKIDEANSSITFNNHGVIQELPLKSASSASSAGASGGGRIVPASRFGGGRPGGPQLGGNPNFSGNNPPPGGNAFAGNNSPPPNTGPVSIGNGGNNSQAQDHLTPEAQVIMMEAERARLLQQGDQPDFAPSLIPPTPITDQVTGNPNDSSEAGGTGGSPNPNPNP